jgi:hypothetical protein
LNKQVICNNIINAAIEMDAQEMISAIFDEKQCNFFEVMNKDLVDIEKDFKTLCPYNYYLVNIGKTLIEMQDSLPSLINESKLWNEEIKPKVESLSNLYSQKFEKPPRSSKAFQVNKIVIDTDSSQKY